MPARIAPTESLLDQVTVSPLTRKLPELPTSVVLKLASDRVDAWLMPPSLKLLVTEPVPLLFSLDATRKLLESLELPSNRVLPELELSVILSVDEL